ncbi:hypothetical protein D1872_194040 [compost metagenome]
MEFRIVRKLPIINTEININPPNKSLSELTLALSLAKLYLLFSTSLLMKSYCSFIYPSMPKLFIIANPEYIPFILTVNFSNDSTILLFPCISFRSNRRGMNIDKKVSTSSAITIEGLRSSNAIKEAMNEMIIPMKLNIFLK